MKSGVPCPETIARHSSSNFELDLPSITPEVAATRPHSVDDCPEEVAKDPAFKSCEFFVGRVLWEDCVDFV